MEVGQAMRAVSHGLAVEDYLLRPKRRQSLGHGHELARPAEQRSLSATS
jgi:hypothetical protein